jgi:hypothetical protein
VRADDGFGVHVVVMIVVVAVHVLVFERLVLVAVAVPLGNVQSDADRHQGARDRQSPAGPRCAEGECRCGADEGRRGEHGSSARCPHQALRPEVELDAQPVAQRPHREEGRRAAERQACPPR